MGSFKERLILGNIGTQHGSSIAWLNSTKFVKLREDISAPRFNHGRALTVEGSKNSYNSIFISEKRAAPHTPNATSCDIRSMGSGVHSKSWRHGDMTTPFIQKNLH